MSIAFILLFSFLLSGCQTAEPLPVVVQPVVVPPPLQHPPVLTAEAEAALALAEQRVVEARAKRALWSAALEALQKARAAAQAFDSEATLRFAKSTIEFCTLGLKQVEYPAVAP